MQTIPQRRAPDFIARRKAFRASALSAIAGSVNDTGDLPGEWAERYREDAPVYTVLSYSTPIAWVTSSGEAVLPGLRYSVTTSRHQHHAASGLGLSFYCIPDEGRAVPHRSYGPRVGW